MLNKDKFSYHYRAVDLDPHKYQPKVLLKDILEVLGEETTSNTHSMSEDEEDFDNVKADPDYMPTSHIFPSAKALRKSPHFTQPYSPSEPLSVTSGTSDTEDTITISDPPSPQYVIDSDECDEFESPEPIEIVPDEPKSPFPFPRYLNGVALYPRDEDPCLLEMTKYSKLNAWHAPNCDCVIPDPAKDNLPEFYLKFGSCPLNQATNFLHESPKLIIENNSVDLFKYYINHCELEKLVIGIHELSRGIVESTSGFAILKLVDPPLMMVRIELHIKQSRIGIFFPVPVLERPHDQDLAIRCSEAFNHLEKRLSSLIVSVKQGKRVWSDEWLSCSDIEITS